VYFGGCYAVRFYCILRDRWKNLRDRFGPLNTLKTLLKCKETGLVKHISTTDNARRKQTNSDPLDRAVASVCGENNDRTYRGLQSSMQVSEALDVEHVDLVDEQHSGHELRHPLVDVLVHDFVDFGAKFVCWHARREAA